MDLLVGESISKHFSGLVALSNVSFTIAKGEILGLIGPNGAGKTTLFNIISGVHQPTNGKVTYRGKDLKGLNLHKIARLGIVRTFQANMLFGKMTCLQNMMVAHYLPSRTRFWQTLFNTPSERKEMRETQQSAMKILEHLGLGDVKYERAANLPHGYQRLLGVALGLSTKPEILLLDEPVTGMNPSEIESMLRVLKEINANGTTLMVVEHNMRAIMNICDRIIVLSFGKKIADGSPTEIRQNEEVLGAYLG